VGSTNRSKFTSRFFLESSWRSYAQAMPAQREKKTSEKSGKGQTERKSPGMKEFLLSVFRLLWIV